MADLSVAKRNAIKQLVEGAPDSVLRMLASAFRSVGGAGAALVRESVEAETADRRVRSAVLAPLLPLFSPRTDGVAALTFPRPVLGRLWRETAARRPELAAQAAEAVAAARYDDPPSPVYDEMCRAAAAVVRAFPDAICPGAAGDLAACLDLAHLARRATDSLRLWTGRPTEEAATDLRLLLKDATAIAEDGTPRILEILLAHLPDAAMVLRVISLARGGAGPAPSSCHCACPCAACGATVRSSPASRVWTCTVPSALKAMSTAPVASTSTGASRGKGLYS